jgi:hypothetical protein
MGFHHIKSTKPKITPQANVDKPADAKTQKIVAVQRSNIAPRIIALGAAIVALLLALYTSSS